MPEYTSFSDFYRFYLAEHKHPANRRMHFIGTSVALVSLIAAVVFFDFRLAVAGFIFGYGCAWFGHFRFERNRPATFKRPLYSFAADWVMYRDILTGRLTMRR